MTMGVFLLIYYLAVFPTLVCLLLYAIHAGWLDWLVMPAARGSRA